MINKQMHEFPASYIGPIGRVAVGWGVYESVHDECKNANIKKALITTTGLKRTGIVDEIKGILEHNGVATELFDKVTSNPKDNQIMEAYEIFKETDCDGVVSVGGGSSHDCGKAVRAVSANDGTNICDLFIQSDWITEPLKWKPINIPQIAVNTTCGTAAEMTHVAIVTNTKTKIKQLCPVRKIAPTMALIDPLLIRLMPQNIAAQTGWDTFMHAFEGYLSKRLIPEAEALCLKSVQLIAENLREFVYNPMNHTACQNMVYAEAMGRLPCAMGAVPSGILSAHEMSHPIGGITDCHHGLASAIVTVPVERAYNVAAFPGKFADMAGAMGVETRGMSKTYAADKCLEEIERLLADLKIKTGHLSEQVGLRKEDLKDVTTRLTTGFAKTEVAFEKVYNLVESLL